MANPNVTYTFVNSTTADATQVNQNFTDLINGATDGTKDYNINAFTAAGTATLNGSVFLGVSSVKDLTINASLASSILIKTNNLYNIGSATLGLAGLYLGSTGSNTLLLSAGTLTSTYTFTYPPAAGSSGSFLKTTGSGIIVFAAPPPKALDNIGLSCSVGSNQLTINVLDGSGGTPSATSPVFVSFRNATAATGTTVSRAITSSLSMTVSSGATLGHTSGVNQYVWVYLIDNSGALELAVSGISVFDDNSIQSTSGVSGSSTSGATLYSTSSRSNVAIRLIGRLLVNEAAAGTWATSPAEISIGAQPKFNATDWATYTPTTQGFGTISAAFFESRRNGPYQEIRGKFTMGTVTSSEGRIGLASGTVDSIAVPSMQKVGDAIWDSNAALQFVIIANGGNSYLNYNYIATGNASSSFAPQNGDFAFSVGQTLFFKAAVPITGWSSYGP